MIIFDRVTHYQRLQDPPILDDASFVLPGKRKVALMGIRGSGRSTVAKLVSGHITQPKTGMVSRGTLKVSYPLGPRISSIPRNTVIQNLIDIARLHGFPQDPLLDFVVHHGDCEELLGRRMSTLTGGEKARVLCPVSYLIPFDYYICDGDPFGAARGYRAHFQALFQDRVRDAGMFYVDNNLLYVRRFCDMGAIFFRGKVTLYDDLEEAIDFYNRVLRPIEESMGPIAEDYDDPGLEEQERARMAEQQEAAKSFVALPPPPGGLFL